MGLKVKCKDCGVTANLLFGQYWMYRCPVCKGEYEPIKLKIQ